MNWIEQGLKDNYDVYNLMLTDLIASNRDSEDNVIDKAFDRKLSESIRRVILSMNVLTYSEVTKHIKEYSEYDDISDDLKQFLNDCQRFVDKIPNNLKNIVEWLNALGDKAKTFWHSDDECIVALVLDKVIDYTNGL